MQYDLIVIGSGPAGQKAAVNAAKMGKQVVVIDRAASLGGVCVHTGTIPSKAFREAVINLTGRRQRGALSAACGAAAADAGVMGAAGRITMADLRACTQQVVRNEIDTIRSQLARNGVRLLDGHAEFVEPHCVRVTRGGATEEMLGRHVLIAVGTRPNRPAGVAFTPGRIIDSDQVLELPELPRSLVIVGGGVIGVEYACIFATAGVRVTLLDKAPRLLPFVDTEIGESLQYQLRDMGVRLRLEEEIASIVPRAGDVLVETCSGKTISTQVAMLASGRQGNTDGLNLAAAGLTADSRGRIAVNEQYQTEVEHIFAAGDVIGFPSLAATSMEQGRLASCHMFGRAWERQNSLFPFGIYTIPEISMVGANESELTRAGEPYEVGVARYREIARGQLMGETFGLLKLLFHPQSRRLLGAHIIGEGATELIHIGQTAMAAGLPIDYFVSTVFNYPTLAECYRVAALDGLNRVGWSEQSEQAPPVERAPAAAAAPSTAGPVPATRPQSGNPVHA